MLRFRVALGLIAAPAGLASAQTPPEQAKIIVDGYGEVRTAPDVATIGYTLRGECATSDEAVRAMVAMGARLESALRHVDAKAEPKTDSVKVSPVKAATCKERNYDSDEQISKGACAIAGYVAIQNVTLRTADVKDAGTMVGLAGRGGAYNASISNFGLSDSGPAKRQAIAAAIVDAQGKAAAVAAGARVGLGQILSVANSERGTGRTEDLINSLPQSFAGRAEMDEPVPVKLTPEPITTSANVTVTYAIAR